MGRFCQNCGSEVSESADYCMNCCVKLNKPISATPAKRYCTNCGAELNANQDVCISCGKIVSSNQTYTNQGYNNNTTASSESSLWQGFKKSWTLTADGVMTRKEYWGAVLFHFLFCLTILYAYVVWLPMIFANIRRSHDINLSGWMILIPYYTLVASFIPSVRPNKYL